MDLALSMQVFILRKYTPKGVLSRTYEADPRNAQVFVHKRYTS